MTNTYSQYFNIDPNYFPAVNDETIKKDPDLWKKYFPHSTFIKLLKNTINVLNRTDRLSLWVEGAYGTGKSHAVLTLKKIFDSLPEDIQWYFSRYKDEFKTNDLYNKIDKIKNSGKVLTVYRYGASNITNDNKLISSIQGSIEKALREHGIENKAKSSLKTGILNWLSDDIKKELFGRIIQEKYSNLFNGENINTIIEHLNMFSGDALDNLITKIIEVGEKEGISAFTLEIDDLVVWIKDVIKANNLHSILFIWDEFSRYFVNNDDTVGFQKLAEISETDNFYFMIVTHETGSIFSENDRNGRKIFDRFVKPFCKIELPENIAFSLLGHAMQKTEDEQLKSQWNNIIDNLYDRTEYSRELVEKTAKINEQQLKNILPIHPYAALLLKNLAQLFASNQRSMFEFIRDKKDEDEKSFQWFIDNYGPFDENPLLTIDMLWNYFYDSHRDKLDRKIRDILDYYNNSANQNLRLDHKRVLKTVLLLQAISQAVGSSVKLFVPNDKNIDNAFEGTDFNQGQARNIADRLVTDHILFKKDLGNNEFQYTAFSNITDNDAIEKNKEKIRGNSTTRLINDANINILDYFSIPTGLKKRLNLSYCSFYDLDTRIKSYNNSENKWQFPTVFIVAKDDNELQNIKNRIATYITETNNQNGIIFIISLVTLGIEAYEQYIQEMANALYQADKDLSQSKMFENNANDYLKQWFKRLSNGSFLVYSFDGTQNKIVGADSLINELDEINKRKYPFAYESKYKNLTDSVFLENQFKKSAINAVNQCFADACNERSRIRETFANAWENPNYWTKFETQQLFISKIKQKIEELINDGFKKEGKISLNTIYETLTDSPYGFMPCNLSAFLLGFVLKEYTNDTYSCSDNMTSTAMSPEQLGTMVESVLKHQQNPNQKYTEYSIVTITKEIKAFTENSAKLFELDNVYTSVESTRDRIRNKMKEWKFPISFLKYILKNEEFKTPEHILMAIIDNYTQLANNNTFGESDNDIATKIGTIFIENQFIIEDLKLIFNKDKCTAGINEYLNIFKNGRLIKLADEINDCGQYLEQLQKKIASTDAANWVWKEETIQQNIEELITEYEIIQYSNNILIPQSNNLKDTISVWCNKCSTIPLSCSIITKQINDLAPLINILCEIKRNGYINQTNKSSFAELLHYQIENLRNFMKRDNQINIFKQVCSNLLENLSDDDINNVFNKIPNNSFTLTPEAYVKEIETIILDHKKNLKITKLKNLWTDKTGTKSPIEWSDIYSIPIIYMLDAKDDKQDAISAFDAVNNSNQDNHTVENALDFFEKSNIFEKLSNKTEINNRFIKYIIKDYKFVIDNIPELIKELRSKYSCPYAWYYNANEIEQFVFNYANLKYKANGHNKAFAQIEQMDSEKVKSYLKDLIKDNLNVGIEILKSKFDEE